MSVMCRNLPCSFRFASAPPSKATGDQSVTFKSSEKGGARCSGTCMGTCDGAARTPGAKFSSRKNRSLRSNIAGRLGVVVCADTDKRAKRRDGAPYEAGCMKGSVPASREQID